jgi:hypothetical protein
VRNHISSHESKRALSGLLTLIRYYPRGLANAAFRKVSRAFGIR